MLPMSVILELFLTSRYKGSTPPSVNAAIALADSSRFLSHFEFTASKDVYLYAVRTGAIDDWLSHEKQSAIHILEEILHRFLCVTAPICIDYLGLDKPWAQLITAISSNLLDSSPNAFLQRKDTVLWLREALGDVSKSLGDGTSVILRGRGHASSPPSLSSSEKKRFDRNESEVIGFHTMKSYTMAHEMKTHKPTAARPVRGVLDLRLQTSSFGQHYLDETPSHSPLFAAEKHLRSTKEPFERRIATEILDRSFSNVRQEIAREILCNLAHQNRHNASSNEASNLGLEDFSPWTWNQREALVGKYAEQIEIIYFAENAILAHKGQRYPGIYYIIDGAVSLRSSSVTGFENNGNVRNLIF